jgi:hypothetical protein
MNAAKVTLGCTRKAAIRRKVITNILDIIVTKPNKTLPETDSTSPATVLIIDVDECLMWNSIFWLKIISKSRLDSVGNNP